MKMNYNGTLTMPANFAALDAEEMTYVDGGKGTLFINKQDALNYLDNRSAMCRDAAGFASVAGSLGLPTGWFSAIAMQWRNEYSQERINLKNNQYLPNYIIVNESVDSGWYLDVYFWRAPYVG